MLFKHSFIYAITQILPAAMTLIGISVFTRLLSPEDYGLYSLTLLLAAAGTTIFYQWLSLSLGRYYQEYVHSDQKVFLLSTTLLSFVLISVVIAIVSGILNLVLESEINFVVVGAVILSGAWFEINKRLSNADLKPSSYAISLGIKSTLAVFGGYVAILAGFGVSGILIALCTSFCVATLVQYRYWMGFSVSKVSKPVFYKMADYGLPLTLTFLMLFVINGSGKFFLDQSIGKSAVGLFSVAFDFTQYIILTICAVLHLAGFPLILKAYTERGEAEGKKQLLKSFNLLLCISMPIVFGLIVTVDEVTAIFLGNEFRESAVIYIPILSIALLTMVFKSYYFDYAFQLAKNTKLQVVGVIAGAIASFVSNPILISYFGIMGACYAILISFLVYLFVCIYLGNKVFDMPRLPWLNISKIIFACVLMVIVVKIIKFENLYILISVKILIGTLAYTVLLWIMNYLGLRNIVKLKLSKNITFK
ncbi:lipopolysaccharide biosynthesis protein [Aliikangiella maris]|uniref:Oligosaccharide flippase family protein n=2 Tax=Aliikangiella maris TaxID=3162458 RepID=A0ABV3MI35_9GAMM